MKRKIIKIVEKKCNGCGLCVEACAEGAIQLVNGKAKLVKDEYCDGLGACIGECPEGAIEIIEREAEAFDEKAVKKHLKKNRLPRQSGKEPSTYPASKPKSWKTNSKFETRKAEVDSQLTNWPIQLKLVSIKSEYFDDTNLLLCADCVPFTEPNFHQQLLPGKKLIIGCPKLDDSDFYVEKFSEILIENNIKSITVAYMEVSCCEGLIHIAKKALEASGKEIPLETIEVKIQK